MTRGKGILRVLLSFTGLGAGIIGLWTGVITGDIALATYLLAVACYMLLIRTVVGDET